jgi:tetratricopeptide (TPR) repeat protein
MATRFATPALILALLGGVVSLQIVRERLAPLPLPENGGAILYVRSPDAIKRAALSYDALAADLYWIRAIQHYGGTKRSTDPDKSYDQLYPLLDLTTSLDPYFDVAYRFGAIFLSEPFPNGPGRPEQAIALLEKGIAAQPTRWEFAQDIGFIHYWWLHQYKDAAEWFVRAADMGGANWLKPLAAVTLAQGGNRASSRQLWLEVLKGSDVDWLRSTAQQRLLQLDAMDQLDTLRRLAREYGQRSGTALRSWRQLIEAGYLRGVPVDPTGQPYRLDGEHGAVSLDPSSRLNPLPEEPLSIAPIPGA